jgi:replication-associated recombination protein RarA
MPLYICRWQNGDFSAVSAASKTDAIALLDEVGNADVCELFTVKNFMVHFSLKQETDELDDFVPVELEGFGEETVDILSERVYLERSEPVLLVGEPGTGKTHLATGLAIAACRQRKRVRFTTAAALVNQLVEAQREQSLTRMLARWSRVELIVIDELGYVPLAEVAAELLFQVIAERAEKAAIIVTTNLPFSEWPQVFTNARLCKAVLDRLTDQAHIIETGAESYRFRRTLRKKRKE